jgi:3-deoxy-manno-octulosonate cytidylyltransferase (CMP-KDO synthetase)
MYRIVIPARFGSTRLPGKPLRDIAGKPMLEWVYERARRCSAREVLIATDDERIADTARAFGAEVIMTAVDHHSGTDRIAEVAAQRGWGDQEVVVNLQGDEPAMPAALIEQVASLMQQWPAADMATLAAPMLDRAEYFDPNAVKVVTDCDGRALYFSRAPIPWHRDELPPNTLPAARRHIGLYAYRVGALRRLASLPPAPLELAEKLEQLRALFNDFEIRVGEAVMRPGPDVNTAEDLARVSARLLDESTAGCD